MIPANFTLSKKKVAAAIVPIVAKPIACKVCGELFRKAAPNQAQCHDCVAESKKLREDRYWPTESDAVRAAFVEGLWERLKGKK